MLAINHCYIPHPPLPAFVEFFWLYEGDIPSHKKERRLPDGAASLVINLRDDLIRIYDKHAPDKLQDRPGSVVSGARSEFALIDTACREEVLGVQFRPGGAFPFLALPTSELHNEVVSLDRVWGEAAIELREQLLVARTRELRFQILEQFLLIRLARFTQVRTVHPAVTYALKEFQSTAYSLSIKILIDRIGIGQTHFIQVFRDVVGLTPKQYCRVMRFQEALRTLERGAPIEWAKLALNCGYYDQAHFIHDFQAFAGMTPGVYLAQQSEHRNHIALPG